MAKDNFRSVVDSVCYWLSYQSKIGRQKLIHEASLRYPIADTITANGTNINRIALEKSYTIFKQRYSDLVVYNEKPEDIEDENNDENIVQVYEFKLVKKETGKKESKEHQRVFNDVVRLAYYHQSKQKKCYFLVCGKLGDFKTYFVESATPNTEADDKLIVKQNRKDRDASIVDTYWNATGIYKDWFAFEINGEKIITFDNQSEKFGLSIFQKEYTIKDNRLEYSDSISLKTKCLAISKTETHSAAIWEIEFKE